MCKCMHTLPVWHVGVCLGVYVVGCLNKKLLGNLNLPDLVDLVARHAIVNFKKVQCFKESIS